jgi:hypothetical protein
MVKYNDNLGTHLCGDTRYEDKVFEVELEVEHSNLQARVEFSSNLNGAAATDEAWGLQNVVIGTEFQTTCATIPELGP